ncbi:alpha-ketoacid dehydrogenase subunit beta [Rhodobacteraceae bacterium NNCM2]|nr:alpha-ketoacid dehydrogenase subunit beta [Coraliihabitans acroporae]
MDKTNERVLTSSQAIAETLAQEMRRDPSVFVLGEDVARFGSLYGNTRGLLEEFGESRVRDTPISETAIVGAAVGAAADGMRPVIELMFADFFGVCYDAIYNLMAKHHFLSGGKIKVPLVLMTGTGGGYADGATQSQSPFAAFAHFPGLKVVSPSNSSDAKGLLAASIRDDSPVVYLFDKRLHGLAWLSSEESAAVHVAEDSYTVEIGKAKIAREGSDVTIVGFGMGVHNALKAADQLAQQGVSAEVVDLMSLVPLDRETIRASVAKTGRLIVVDDDYLSYGMTGEIIASVTEHDISVLKAAPKRVAHPDVPIPCARDVEAEFMPDAGKIVAAWGEMKAA